jgi:hypothetical protein
MIRTVLSFTLTPARLVYPVFGLAGCAIVGLGLAAELTVNQALAVVFTLIVITLWNFDRLSGLIAGLIFFMTKAFWVRVAFGLDSSLYSSNGFDLLGVTPPVLLAALIMWQLCLAWSSREKLLVDRSRKLTAIFSVIALASIFLGSPLVGLGGFERNILPNMLIIFLGASLINNRLQFDKLAKSLLVLGLISCLYAIGQYAMGLYPWEVSWFRNLTFDDGLSGWLTIGLRGIEFRVFSIFYGYMDFFFTNVLIFILAMSFEESWDKRWRSVYGLYLIFWLAILFLSLERMAVLMTILGAIAVKFSISSRDIRKRIAGIAVISSLFVYIALLAGGPFLKSTGADKLIRLAELASPFQASSIVDRTETKWLPAVETIINHPLGVGIGYGSQTRAKDSAMLSSYFVQPHNELIQKTMETGILGGLIYLLLLISIFNDSLKVSKIQWSKPAGVALTSGTIVLGICGLVNLPFSGSSGLLYWLLAGSLLGLKDSFGTGDPAGMSQFETSAKQLSQKADMQNGATVQDETGNTSAE